MKIFRRPPALFGVSGVIATGALIYQLIQRSGISFSAVILVIIFSAFVFGIVFLIINQISRFSSSTSSPSFPLKEKSESLFADKNDNQRPAHFQSTPNSGTEYTTRNLENVFGEKR